MSSAPRVVELRAGDLRLALRPDLGGAIAGLWHGSDAVMRNTEAGALESSRKSACYPLVPYSNRIALRRFRWQKRDYTTMQNFDDNPHSVHGVGWLREWEVLSADDSSAELRYVHTPDGHWPFEFDVRQRFKLTPDTLDVQLHFTNTASLTQPVGLGWHPYFPKRQRSRLHIELSDRWEPDAMELPIRRVAQPGIDADIAHLNFDNCFEGWRGTAKLRDEKLAIGIRSSESYLVIYTPQTKDYYCVEPVSHVSNAIHMSDPLAHGLRAVEPGQTTQASMTLSVQRV